MIAKLLSQKLGQAIVAQRIRAVILPVHSPASVKDIVRGYVYKKRSNLFRHLRYYPRPFNINFICQLSFLLASIHICESCAVNYDLRLYAHYRFRNRRPIQEIKFNCSPKARSIMSISGKDLISPGLSQLSNLSP